MSKELPTNPKPNEEVDLIIFFNLIGNAISKVLGFIGSILKTIFSTIIYIIRVLIDNWKIVIGSIVISAVAGYFLEKNKPAVYSSEMLVRPYFESKFSACNKYQLF